MVKNYSFPEKYQVKIAEALKTLGFSLENPRQLAVGVKKLSDHYQQNTKVTPWQEPEFLAAYLAYFFPLNYIRNLKVFDEFSSFKDKLVFEDYVDFGFGLGSSLLAAQDIGVVKDHHRIHALDISPKPLDIFSRYLSSTTFERQYRSNKEQKSLGVFSYSLNELNDVPPWFYSLDTIVILEPSTSQWGRKLMQWRESLKAQGYFLWAPCTHQNACPLLVHSKRDWCHDRVHWEQPQWFSELEAHLPMKNHTMTHSYLIASKVAPTTSSEIGRIVGDELVEKGKSRWLYCRGEQREFLSWLNKQGAPPSWHRGELLAPQIEAVKGNELRIKLY